MEVTIEGMGCGHCVASVREALGSVTGIEVEKVEIGSAAVLLPEGAGPSRERVLEAIRSAGYEPRD
jgi:copper chaperone